MSLSKTTINFIMNEFSRIKDTFIFISPEIMIHITENHFIKY